MDIQLGRSKTVRRAYGIDEIALVPGGRTVDPEVTDTRWSLGGIEREIPIIASAMDGVVDVDMAIRLSNLGALGVLNLEGVQTRYADPNAVLDRIAAVGKDEFVPLMQPARARGADPSADSGDQARRWHCCRKWNTCCSPPVWIGHCRSGC